MKKIWIRIAEMWRAVYRWLMATPETPYDAESDTRQGLGELEDYKVFTVDIVTAYPKQARYIRDLIEMDAPPSNTFLSGLFEQAKTIKPDEWALLGVHVNFMNDRERERRAFVLELLRQWITEETHEKAGGPILIELQVDPAQKPYWKL